MKSIKKVLAVLSISFLLSSAALAVSQISEPGYDGPRTPPTKNICSCR